MSKHNDLDTLAISALAGGLATLIQEMVASKLLNPEQLHQRLETYKQQEAIQTEPLPQRRAIESIIEILQDGVALGQEELPTSQANGGLKP